MGTGKPSAILTGNRRRSATLQTIAVVKVIEILCAHYAHASLAEFIFHHVGPNVVDFAEGDVEGSPRFKSRSYAHYYAHELIPAVVALAQIDAFVGCVRFLALVPK